MKFVFLSSLDLNLYLFRLDIMKALKKNGHTVIAIIPKGDYFLKLEQEGFKVIDYNLNRGSLSPFSALNSILKLSQILKTLQPDILHTFTVKPNIFGTIAGKIAKIPKIINLVEGMGSFYVDNSFKSKIIRIIIEFSYKIVFKFSNQVIFVNNDDPKYLISKNIITSSKVKVIRSVGIDTKKYSLESISKETQEQYRKNLNIKPNQKIVTMIGRAILHKGTKDFYQSAEILSNNKNIKFIFIGDIDKGNKFSMSKKFMESGFVDWLGFRNDVKELISISDVIVLPSYREGIPRTLLEALAMGKPIITTDTVGCREVVENKKNGYLISIKSPKDISAKIMLLFNNSVQYHNFSVFSRKKAITEFEITKIVTEYLENYKRILNDPRRT